MLQRIQTVYMAIAFLVMGVLPFVFPLWRETSQTAGGAVTTAHDFYFMESSTYTGIIGLSVSLALLAILFYQKRQRQFVINRLNIILNLILLGLFVYRSLNLSGGTSVPEKGIGMFLPIISIVFLVLANKAIKKDEDLVKSVDRLR